MNRLSIRVLGPFYAAADETLPLKFRTSRVQALLVYLACEQVLGTSVVRRKGLLDLLWPGMPETSAYQNLRQIIYQLKKVTPDLPGQEGEPPVSLLLTDRQTIGINPAYPLDLDLARFRHLLKGQPSQWAAAVELYRGDFLSDFSLSDTATFEAWAHARRTAFRQQALDTLASLAIYYNDHGFYDRAIAFARRRIELDDLSETGYRQLMIALASSGRQAEALAVYNDLHVLLEKELAIEPDETTTALRREIYAGSYRPGSQSARAMRGFELQEQIGAGSFGAVYRAQQPAVGREVAIKVILPKFANDPNFIRHFEAEAQTIARLEHPHIVPLYDFWREPNNAYLVMRYLRGGSLQEALPRRGFAPQRVDQIVMQIAAALESAHQQGVIHRDIKPGNILLDDAGNAYLSDFGIARHQDGKGLERPYEQLITSTSSLAPEQIRHEPITPAADIYTLGVLIYYLLCGQPPFESDSVAELLYKHAHEPLPPVRETHPELPPAIDEVVQRATAKRPGDRYPSATAVADALRVALEDTLAPDLQARPQREIDIDNPYKGLRPFTADDASLFFGREAITDRLLERFGHEERFIAVVGPSGSGKSSLVRAGLLPALRRDTVPGSARWFIVDMMPGGHPFEELELALQRVAVRAIPTMLADMKADGRGILRTMRRALPDDDSPLLLVIDQFEELFTLVEDPATTHAFLEGLRVALLDPKAPLRLVITLRADFYDRILLVPGFSELVRSQTEVVTPMNPEELARAISRPAELTGVAVEPALVTQMVTDINEQPGGLPLLQYALSELYASREDDHLTLSQYRRLGGLTEVLGRRAEEIYQGLDTNSQPATRQMFLRLVTLGEGGAATRRRVRRSELMEITEGQLAVVDAQQRHLLHNHPLMNPGNAPLTIDQSPLEAFGKARLLSFDREPITREPTVEVAHEALFREWPRLRNWLEEGRYDVRMQRLLAQTVGEWVEAERDAGFLLRDARLDQFAGWAERGLVALTADEQEFIEASVAARAERLAEEEARRQRELRTAQQLAETEKARAEAEQQRAETQARRAEEQAAAAHSLRRRAVYLGAAAALAVLLAIVAGMFGQRASTNALAAEANAATAVAEGVRADSERNLALAARATSEAEAEARATAEAEANEQRDAALTAEGEALAQRDVAQAQTKLAISRELSQAAANVLEEDPELSMLLAMKALDHAYTKQAEEALRSALQQSRALLTIQIGEPVYYASYTPDGSKIVAETESMIGLWDGVTGELMSSAPVSGTPYWRQFDESGDEIFFVFRREDDEGVVLFAWDMESPEIRELQFFDVELPTFMSGVLSPDGALLAIGNASNGAELWDTETGEQLFVLNTYESVAWDYDFNEDGSWLLIGTAEGELEIFDIPASLEAGLPQSITAFRAVEEERLFLARFSLSGEEVFLTFRNQQPLEVWDVSTPGDPQLVRIIDSGVGRADASNQDETWIIENYGAGLNSTVTVWEAATGEPLFTLNGHKSVSLSAVFSPDGKTILTSNFDGTVRVWDASQWIGGEVQTGHFPGVGFDLQLSPDEQLIALGSFFAHALFPAAVLDRHTFELVHLLEPDESAIYRTSFHPDGSRLATVGGDNVIRIWDMDTGEVLLSWVGHELGYFTSGSMPGVLDVSYSPDGTRLATASSDSTAKVWDAETGAELLVLEGHTTGLATLEYSPDGQMIATGSDNPEDTVRVWDAETGDELFVLPADSRVWALAFSPDSRLLATGGAGGFVHLWDLTTGNRLYALPPQSGTVGTILFTRDGQQFLTMGAQATHLWDVATGAEIKKIASGGMFGAALAEGGTLFYGSSPVEGIIRVLTLDSEDTIAIAQERLTRSLTEAECQQYLHVDVCPQE